MRDGRCDIQTSEVTNRYTLPMPFSKGKCGVRIQLCTSKLTICFGFCRRGVIGYRSAYTPFYSLATLSGAYGPGVGTLVVAIGAVIGLRAVCSRKCLSPRQTVASRRYDGPMT